MATRRLLLLSSKQSSVGAVASRFGFVLNVSKTKIGGGGGVCVRHLSSGGGGNGGKDDDDDDDPFGLSSDNNNSLGNKHPPKYVRDKATGKLTGEVETELCEKEKRLLGMDDVEKERELIQRLVQKWSGNNNDNDNDDNDDPLQSLGKRVGEEEMALNTFGRDANATTTTANNTTTTTSPLSQQEFQSFAKYMKKQHNVQLTKQDIPTMPSDHNDTQNKYNSENPDLDLAWMSGQRQLLDEATEHDPSSVQPSDFSPARLVNRKKAKPIPTELLHHNNLALLRRYVTPNGQIMNRAQSRLGAKDQRRVAGMIKRARAIGLIPYTGQWKYENHGNIREEGIQHEDKDWEVELKQRGLVVGTNGSDRNN